MVTWSLARRSSVAVPMARGAGIVVVCLVAVAAGVAAALFSGVLPIVALAVAVIVFLLAAPIWVFAPLVLVGTVVSDAMRVHLGATSEAAMLGQGRLLVVIAAVVAVRLLLAQRQVRLPLAATIPIALYVCVLLFTALVSTGEGTLEFGELQRSLAYVLAFLVGVAAVPRAEALRPVARALAVVVVLGGVAGLAYWAWVTSWITVPAGIGSYFETVWRHGQDSGLDLSRSRMPWPDHHPNRVAVLFVLLIAFTVPQLMRTQRAGDAVLAALVVVAGTGGALATQSRTGVVLLAIVWAAFVAFALVGRRGGGRAALLLVLAAVVPLAVLGYGQLTDDRPLTLNAENFETRQATWVDALHAFDESPLVGHGLDYAGRPEFGGGLSAHSEYLGQLVDGGILGGAVFAVLLLAFARLSWRVARRGGPEASLGVAMLLFFVVLGVAMTVGALWRTAAPAVISWLFFGIVTAVYALQTPQEALRATGRAAPATRSTRRGPSARLGPPHA